ncbi:peptidase T [Vagococcus salmoninarum]|uniref:Peptidase T n=1 Tax=Vagococcus salmoninarum TaxID=2739 RepID=A0A429ZS41_9ENTE|nr:peptidase T [Vagococcus salmoninarum]RST96532.1 peptidase T [Vagococcus salmoninarum]
MTFSLLESFIKYAKINTRSDGSSTSVPTTASQVAFAKEFAQDLQALGLSEVEYLEQNAFVTATLPSNTQSVGPVIGLIAHYDTADYHAENIQPQVHPNYDGEDILLNAAEGITLSVQEFPNLKDYRGQTLITTDGTTLLGADDKAGIVEILGAVDYFLQHPELPRCEVRLAFGPDEEIGKGADLFDASHFRAKYAYTIDSGRVGHLEYETFNAAQGTVTIDGLSVHPGTAKNSLINAIKLGKQLDDLLPQNEVPEATEGYEGFYLLNKFSGTVDRAELVYIIRDHDSQKFLERQAFLKAKVAEINASLDKERLSLTLEDQYYNMGEIIKGDFYPVELALKAMENLQIKPIVTPFRGGTDGSKISFKGIPTPNIFTGGENFHGQYEFISLEAMETVVATLIEIIQLNTKGYKN